MERMSKNAREDICRLTIKQRLRKKATEMHESLREWGRREENLERGEI